MILLNPASATITFATYQRRIRVPFRSAQQAK
jgi:hypothetical protein